MKRKCTFLLTALFLLISMPHAEAKQYCGEPQNIGGINMRVTCEKQAEDRYVMIFDIIGDGTFYSLNTAYGGLNGSGSYDYKNYGNLSADKKTATFIFPQKPTPTGNPCLFLVNSASNYAYYWPTEIEWGVCAAPDHPVMLDIDFVSAGSKIITLKPTAIVNNGANQVTEYRVSYGSETRDITINADGNIVIDGLQPDTQYTFTIKALYKGNESEKDKTIIASTTSLTDNLALNKPVTVAYDEANKSKIVDGDEGNRWSTEHRPDISYDWVQVDLTEIYYINSIKIKWETACPLKYQILLSMDGTNWLVWQHNEAPTTNLLTNYAIGGLAARYIKVISQENATQFGISIYELQAFGTGVEYTANTSAPALTASLGTATATQAEINVSASDNQTTPITNFEVDGVMYAAEDGKILIDNLTPCMQYQWQVCAVDQEGNKSEYITISYTTPEAPEGTNLALNKPIYTGFYEGGLIASYAVDGDNKTRWGARYRPTSDDEWLVIDLQGYFKINRIEVAWETGTSINYEFKSAWNAEFGQREIQGVNDDKSLQETKVCDQIISGNFSTFEHKNEQPTSAKDNRNDKANADKDERVWDVYEYNEPVYARYVKLESGLIAAYPASLWEFKVYGECANLTEKPVMQWAEVISVEDDAAEIYVSALDDITSEENMQYEVLLTSGEEGYFQLTTTYTFGPEHFLNGNAGYLPLGGLLPNIPYEAKIYAIDEHGNKSENYKLLIFNTIDATGCVFASKEAFNIAEKDNHSTQIFQKGYRVVITTGTNEFTVTAYTEDDFWALENPIVQILNDPDNPATSGVKEFTMAPVEGEERTYSYTFNNSHINPFSGTITFFIKFPFNNGGICLTQPITYDIDNGCISPFVIYHHDDKPTSTALVSCDQSQITSPIRYYRRFTAGVWEDLTMPFEVENIMVYDTEDHQYYELKAQYNDGGTTKKGKFLLRKQQDNVSGADFVESWYDGDTPLPIKHQPYAIRFTSNYYADKYVLFCGAKGQDIETSFTKGAAPTADDQYTVYGNPTMQTQSVGNAYMLPADHSDETYRLVEGASVKPFETYVLASDQTMSVMKKIAPWTGAPNIASSLDEVAITLTEQPVVELFTLTGLRLGVWYQCSMQRVADECAMNYPAGCYIIRAGENTVKVIVR